MFKRKRQGNLLITVLVFMMLTLVLGGLFTSVTAQKTKAMVKAKTAGDVNSYITLCNLCAYALKSDLEGQAAYVVVATVANPEGLLDGEYGLEVYDEAVQEIQLGIADNTRSDAENPAAWFHTLTNPRDALDYEGITNPGVIETADRLLENATVSIKVLGPLAATPSSNNTSSFNNGDSAVIDDILFQVVLKKGTTKVIQNYCLTNEKITGRFDTSGAYMTVHGDDAELLLESQTVTRKNLEPVT